MDTANNLCSSSVSGRALYFNRAGLMLSRPEDFEDLKRTRLHTYQTLIYLDGRSQKQEGGKQGGSELGSEKVQLNNELNMLHFLTGSDS